jgi:hypothetical protein
MKPNDQFKLTVDDIDLIESSLRKAMIDNEKHASLIVDLLARIHHQKNWYRPKKYIGG